MMQSLFLKVMASSITPKLATTTEAFNLFVNLQIKLTKVLKLLFNTMKEGRVCKQKVFKEEEDNIRVLSRH